MENEQNPTKKAELPLGESGATDTQRENLEPTETPQDTTGTSGPQDSSDGPTSPPGTEESPDRPQGTADTQSAPEEPSDTLREPQGTAESTGPQDTPDAPVVPPETEVSTDGVKETSDPQPAPEKMNEASNLSQEIHDKPQAADQRVEETGAASDPQGITDVPPVLPESSDTVDSPQALETGNEGPPSTDVDVPPIPSDSEDGSNKRRETEGSPLESEEAPDLRFYSPLPQDTIDPSQTLPESTDSPEGGQKTNEPLTVSRENTLGSFMPEPIPAPMVTAAEFDPQRAGFGAVNSQEFRSQHKKKLSIDKLHRFSFKLSVLRLKQYEIIRRLKIMEAARPKYVFADLEIKSALSERDPEKEKLLYLFSENKRLEEKCFYGDIENKKCLVMTSFYTGKRQEFLNILETLSSMTSNEEAEDYLVSIKNHLIEELKVTQEKLEEHQKAMAIRTKEFQQLTMKIMKAAETSSVSQGLRMKLKKGTPLTDDEILQLTLEKCLDTNNKLKTSIQSLGVQIDNLREQYLWKRNEFVCKLSSEFDNSELQTVPPDVKTPEESNPPTPTGSLYDIIIDQSSMAGRMARLGRNAEDLISYHYKLKDLKSRIITTSGYEKPKSREDSLTAIPSGTPTSQRP
ncbi:hypothetical protein GE061_009998 [Apolygus lucorum]|uniref:Uncharacterized protein n=1 Tax=Apolygus lucorum TaxID=248454 RepID=A0A8S9Y4I2_APOLU|nr:hypothetical protein GE061_009998 [Apolygus lucorum]